MGQKTTEAAEHIDDPDTNSLSIDMHEALHDVFAYLSSPSRDIMNCIRRSV